MIAFVDKNSWREFPESLHQARDHVYAYHIQIIPTEIIDDTNFSKYFKLYIKMYKENIIDKNKSDIFYLIHVLSFIIIIILILYYITLMLQNKIYKLIRKNLRN